MSLLDDYIFDDCLVVDLYVSPRLEEVFITCEAFFLPLKDEIIRPKGLLAISCKKVFKFNALIYQELSRDLARSYNLEGDDLRANEIIDLNVMVGQQSQTILSLQSDMLNLNVECLEFSAERVKVNGL